MPRLVHQHSTPMAVIANHTEATVSGCMHAYLSFMQSVSSSYFDAASLAGALLAASFLGAWTSRRGLAGIEGVVSSFMMSSCS